MCAPLFGRAAAFAALLSLSSCLTGFHVCPRSLDCARAGRHFCQPGTTLCGPCLHPLVENVHGRCVVKRRHTHHPVQSIKGKVSVYPELDEQIDFLSAIISEQRTESVVPAPPSQDETFSEPSSQSTAPTSTASSTTTNHTSGLLRDPIFVPYTSTDFVFISTVMSGVFIVAASLVLIVAGACWVRFHRGLRLTQKVDYPAHGLVKAQTFSSFPGDKKLIHSAQMFHYQHQKQQMLSLEKNKEDPKVFESGMSTDEENEDGDFTVYECPGLAPTGEMEVKNPLFEDLNLHLQTFHK